MKDFVNIVELSKELETQIPVIQRMLASNPHADERIFNLRIQLAIAQQLSIIAKHLSNLASDFRDYGIGILHRETHGGDVD